jgi:fatty-acyl-CoA synthase
VREAAVIAVPDERWQERPRAVVVAREQADVDEDALMQHLARRFPRWWLPDSIVFTAQPLPRTALGKLRKSEIRTRFGSASRPPARRP